MDNMKRSLVTFLAVTLSALAALWALLTDADPGAWLLGVPALLAAAWAAWKLGGDVEAGLSPLGLLRFAPFFVWESLRGGLDVAARTLAPRMRIRPGFFLYRTRLLRQDARVFLANCVSLLPGSLAADLDGDHLEIHLLDAEADPSRDLRRLELAVARVFSDRGTQGGKPS